MSLPCELWDISDNKCNLKLNKQKTFTTKTVMMILFLKRPVGYLMVVMLTKRYEKKLKQ